MSATKKKQEILRAGGDSASCSPESLICSSLPRGLPERLGPEEHCAQGQSGAIVLDSFPQIPHRPSGNGNPPSSLPDISQGRRVNGHEELASQRPHFKRKLFSRLRPFQQVRVRSMAKNTIRRATLADVSQTADVFGSGFMDDDLWGRFMHPKRREFPDDWLGYWKKTVRKQIASPTGFCLVGVDKHGTIKACMLVTKMGDASQIIADEGAGDASEMARAAQEDASFTDRAADPEHVAIFENHWPNIKHHFVGPRANAWMIDLLCVHPDVQRGGGYGRDLIQKGIELGKREQPPVPVAVIASIMGDPVYEKYGFREAGRADVGDLKVEGGSLKYYEEHLRQ